MTVDLASIATLLAIAGVAFKLYSDWRTDRRTTASYQRDLAHDNDVIQQRLYDSLSKGGAEFRQTVYAAYLESRATEKELRERLDSVTSQLTIITAERDLANRELERSREQVFVLERTVHDQAKQIDSQAKQIDSQAKQIDSQAKQIQALQAQVARLTPRQMEADR